MVSATTARVENFLNFRLSRFFRTFVPGSQTILSVSSHMALTEDLNIYRSMYKLLRLIIQSRSHLCL